MPWLRVPSCCLLCPAAAGVAWRSMHAQPLMPAAGVLLQELKVIGPQQISAGAIFDAQQLCSLRAASVKLAFPVHAWRCFPAGMCGTPSSCKVQSPTPSCW